MTQRQKTPAPVAAPSIDNLHGNIEAIHMAGKVKAALENIMSAPLENKKLSELPTKAARLNTLADAIEAQALVKDGIGFNMAKYYDHAFIHKDKMGHACGTIACIAGWTTLMEDGLASAMPGNNMSKSGK